jgi:hypothetical protein
VKLPVGFDPGGAASAAGAKRHTWSKLGDGPWSGQVFTRGDINGSPDLVVEELATSWKVIDVYAGTSSQGRDLEQLLTKTLKGMTNAQ